jgi:hypothetical protein
MVKVPITGGTVARLHREITRLEREREVLRARLAAAEGALRELPVLQQIAESAMREKEPEMQHSALYVIARTLREVNKAAPAPVGDGEEVPARE